MPGVHGALVSIQALIGVLPAHCSWAGRALVPKLRAIVGRPSWQDSYNLPTGFSGISPYLIHISFPTPVQTLKYSLPSALFDSVTRNKQGFGSGGCCFFLFPQELAEPSSVGHSQRILAGGVGSLGACLRVGLLSLPGGQPQASATATPEGSLGH